MEYGPTVMIGVDRAIRATYAHAGSQDNHCWCEPINKYHNINTNTSTNDNTNTSTNTNTNINTNTNDNYDRGRVIWATYAQWALPILDFNNGSHYGCVSIWINTNR